MWQMLATMETELGVPIDRMRLWKVEHRDNGSRRPMGCLRAKQLSDVVAKEHMSSGSNSRCAFYMEVSLWVALLCATNSRALHARTH